MSLPNPHREDELDHLVRGALSARAGGKEPPDRVWKQIKSELQTDRRPPARQPRFAWSPLAIQVALTVMLVMLGGVGLRTLLEPDSFRGNLFDVSPSGTIAYVAEASDSPTVAAFDDRAELRSLRADLSSRPAVGRNNLSPIVVARDVPPNVLFSEDQAVDPDPSLSLIVNEQNPIRSGPYPWYR